MRRKSKGASFLLIQVNQGDRCICAYAYMETHKTADRPAAADDGPSDPMIDSRKPTARTLNIIVRCIWHHHLVP
ncbi:hypothetical protein I305_02013 [Cryptococcus gattii E566]|uniref:Uncharacterized protein n=2 Tax=Cryptococcus gattii TaxID=37769 RepID=E6R4H8_CRYGW|nr:Hypothetical Protein CGB_D7030C [Cryptococcus gattii WM276]ADV22070.1 Hypothetical Protein CGB_D7030C [Cryptococcus gattii WM276]KIR80385.1 hypothetical protein I306_02361 [Cryptococcus gattii EJB2]KIY35760.1 hypothetical protein I305_02013 [Cryptococcus gattii E566]KJD99808.1 hypothetical protein I311_06597 [Cryptococcus gattii NT-10]